MTINIIAAIGKNRELGYQGHMPWSFVKEDMKHFYKTTVLQTVVMGRKTRDSLPNGELPKRQNIVLSRTEEGCARSAEEALEQAIHSEVWVIGGQQIYEMFLPLAQMLVITHMDGEFNADVFFPEFEDGWEEFKRVDLAEGVHVSYYARAIYAGHT